jgi:uncharacterized protein YbjQ (UPF0145 family)
LCEDFVTQTRNEPTSALKEKDSKNSSSTMAAVARELGVNALINMSQMTVSQMSIQNITPSPQQRQHWLSANVCLIHQ